MRGSLVVVDRGLSTVWHLSISVEDIFWLLPRIHEATDGSESYQIPSPGLREQHLSSFANALLTAPLSSCCSGRLWKRKQSENLDLELLEEH